MALGGADALFVVSLKNVTFRPNETDSVIVCAFFNDNVGIEKLLLLGIEPAKFVLSQRDVISFFISLSSSLIAP